MQAEIERDECRKEPSQNPEPGGGSFSAKRGGTKNKNKKRQKEELLGFPSFSSLGRVVFKNQAPRQCPGKEAEGQSLVR